MSVLELSVVLFSTLLAVVEGVSVCPVQSSPTHQVRLHGDFCYQFHLSETRGFSAAQAECRSQGGYEVIIRDADTQQFIHDVLQKDFSYTGLVWIGLNDVSKEGVFTWVDGSPMNFSFWAAGQPGGLLGGIEDCVALDMGDGGRWHDYRCEDFLFLRDPHPFICQFGLKYMGSTVTLPPPATTTTAVKPSTPQLSTPQPSTPQPSTIQPSTASPTTAQQQQKN